MKPLVKLSLVQDVEDRIHAETDEISLIKLQFMEKLDEVSSSSRKVKFSELLYDESANVIKYIHSAYRSEPNMQELRSKLQSIYKYRIQQAHRSSIHEQGDGLTILHSEIIGNLLTLYPHNRDLLFPFYNRALPLNARKSLWKSLLLFPEVEEQYQQLFINSRISTISKNEVEITKKAVEVFSHYCPQLAYDSKVINYARTVLSYIECTYQRLLPDFQYYLQLPIFYILNEMGINMPTLIGVCLRISEIQNTVWPDNSEESITDIFLSILYKLDSDLYNHLNNIIDSRNPNSSEKLENFLKPFMARLTSGYLNIDVTCMIYDQFIMVNSKNKIHYILVLVLMTFKQKLLTVTNWDEFLAEFYDSCKRITVEELEPLLERIPLIEKIDGKRCVPDEYVGQDYLTYIQNAKESAAIQAISTTGALGNIVSMQRILEKTGEEGIKAQQVLKGNWYDVMLNFDMRKFMKKDEDKKEPVARNEDMLGLQNYVKDAKSPALLSFITNPESLKNNIRSINQPQDPNSQYEQFTNPKLLHSSGINSSGIDSQGIYSPGAFSPSLLSPKKSSLQSKNSSGTLNLKNPSIKVADSRYSLPPDASYLKGGLIQLPMQKRIKPRYYSNFDDKLK